MSDKYRSSIPKTAREHIIEKYPNGKKKRAEYRLNGQVVGVRWFFETGEPEFELPFKNGKKHGTEYDWFYPNRLSFAEPYVDGVPHGTTKQWSSDGKLIGTYRMKHGTGIDLWRGEQEDGSVYLSEVRFWKNGIICGFGWDVNEDQESVHSELHCNNNGLMHGICRRWNAQGRLRRGFPQYHVNNKKVTKRQYLRACEEDSTLPPFRVKDNSPLRVFPPEIAKELRPRFSS